MFSSTRNAVIVAAAVFTATAAAIIAILLSPGEIHSQTRGPDDFDPLAWNFEAAGNLGDTSPAIQDAVFVSAYDDQLYALDGAAGDVLWRYRPMAKLRPPRPSAGRARRREGHPHRQPRAPVVPLSSRRHPALPWRWESLQSIFTPLRQALRQGTR